MSSIYRRLLNEYYKINTIDDSISYKLFTIDSEDIMFRCDISFYYKNSIYELKIYYNRFYPFQCPFKLEINNINLFNIYKKIMIKNVELLNNNCLCCKSLLCNNNWDISKNIINILEEVKTVIDYNELYIKRKLLRKIAEKYTNQHLDYLEQYLL